MKKLLYIIIAFVCSIGLHAQELNADIRINTSKLQGSQQVMKTLEEQLRTFINERKWTNVNFLPNERIDCSFSIIVNEMSSNTYSAELQIQSSRPVYNSTYTTTLINFRDPDFTFEYVEYQAMEFDINNIQDNLVATIAFYIYMILGIDFDSMSPFGGTPYFRNMQAIANNVQTNNWPGWETFGSDRSRYAIADAFNTPAYESYRQMWYDYHRLGLDEMATNVDKGKPKIFSSVSTVSALHSQRPGLVLVTLFGDAKMDELANVYLEATDQEKKKAYETLRNVYPTKTKELDKIRDAKSPK